MRVEWYGQSAFRLIGDDAKVFIDPIGDIAGLAARGIRFDYPPLDGVDADLVLITHEHRTERISFLEPADEFLERMGNVEKLDETSFDTGVLESNATPLVVVPAAP